MVKQDTGIPGLFTLQARVFADARGGFVKTFHADDHAALGLRTDWREEYYTSSRAGVVRGMHFQTPPADHAKIVFCVSGAVNDVVVDLRRGSPTFGHHRSFDLDAKAGLGLYIPLGCAHGFASTHVESVMYYKVTSVHAPAHDAGISWDSFGYRWPIDDPIISDRDRSHPRLEDFDTPFAFDPATASR